MADIILATLVLTPVAMTLLFRSNGALAFLAACGGYTAYFLSGSDLENLAHSLKLGLKQGDFGLIFMVVLPMLTLLLTFRAVNGKYRVLMHGAAALAAGGLMAYASAPFLNSTTNLTIYNSSVWSLLQSTISYVAGIGVVGSLILLWFKPRKSHSKKH